MRRIFLSIVIILVIQITQAQVRISGQIMEENGKVLSAASIFLAGTSYGTIADDSGKFVLTSIPAGRYDLIVSFSGYRTYSQAIDVRTISNFSLPIVTMQLASSELEPVVVSPFVKSDWVTWGKFFLENFLGTVPEANQCKLKNHKVLEFRDYRKSGKLKVIANEPLIIENRALGYNLRYQLEQFEYNFKTGVLLYTGYPLFKPEVARNPKQQARWEAARAKTYFGSYLHFMRSIYRNKLPEEGFEMRSLVKMTNAEKQRVKTIMKNTITTGSIAINLNEPEAGGFPSSDSMIYYRKVLRQADTIDYLYPQIIPADSVAYQVNPQTAGMFFENYLQITYLNAKEDKTYPPLRKNTDLVPGNPTSLITLTNGNSIEIDKSGAFFAPLDLLLHGYWAWSQKIATMLPYDYLPPELPPVK